MTSFSSVIRSAFSTCISAAYIIQDIKLLIIFSSRVWLFSDVLRPNACSGFIQTLVRQNCHLC